MDEDVHDVVDVGDVDYADGDVVVDVEGILDEAAGHDFGCADHDDVFHGVVDAEDVEDMDDEAVDDDAAVDVGNDDGDGADAEDVGGVDDDDVGEDDEDVDDDDDTKSSRSKST